MKSFFSAIIPLVFWSWNICFLSLAYLGILPFIGLALLLATFEGSVPLDLSLTIGCLILVPTVSCFLAITRFWQQPRKLLALFYGVEAPLFILCLVRLFLVREFTPAGSLVVGTVFLAVAAFAYHLFFGSLAVEQAPSGVMGERGRVGFGDGINSGIDQGRNDRIVSPLANQATHQEINSGVSQEFNRNTVKVGKLQLPREPLAWVQLGSHSLMSLVGLYAATILLFYALPLGFSGVVYLLLFTWVADLWAIISASPITIIWQLSIFLMLIAFSSTLFVIMPSVYGFLYAYTGWLGWKDFEKGYGRNKARLGAIATLTAWSILFFTLQQQPQIKAFSLLENPGGNEGDRQELVKKSDTIRQGLLNSYLLSYRYLSTVDENNHIAALHKSVFNLPDETANLIQAAYNQLLTPFLYQGDRADMEKAEKLYGQFFDTSIQKAEAPLISKAIESTWNRDEAKAGLLNINQQKVWLQKQEVKVTEQGDWAEVELYEMYENQTPDLQEVYYSFSLPESAVITGLWLGDTDDRAKRFPYQVSPRGAAQQVYNDQVQAQVDPALLEQVGTRQYRLRAFPIPAKRLRIDPNPANPTPTHMHLWLTYKVMQQPQGWALPDLGEKRNVYWNWSSQRTINGKSINKFSAGDDWLPAFVEATKPFNLQPHQVTFPKGEVISAQPFAAGDYVLPQGQRFAVIIDTSRSMTAQKQALAKTWDWLNQNIAKNNEIHLYLTGTLGAEPRRIADLKSFDLQQLTYFGSLQFPEMLQQFSQLQGDTIYDAVLLLTDDGSYDLAQDEVKLPAIKAPLWMVHLAGLPPAYDDVTLKAVQDSGGGVSTNAQEVIQRIATTGQFNKLNKSDKSLVSLVDGYGWYRSGKPNPPVSNTANSQPQVPTNLSQDFAPLAARQLALALSQETKGRDIQGSELLAKLDGIQALAKQYGIVTPYSSMIVLVNDQQREALKQAESRVDRFDREVETGAENLTQPNNPFAVEPVPEPKVFIFISLGAVALMWWYRRRSVV
jgi:putative PEP-CTERM system integral membrane protein